MTRNDIILVGAGGHALSLAEFASKDILGYLAFSQSPQMPGEWLGTDDDAIQFIQKNYLFHIAFVYAGLPVMDKRKKLIVRYENTGARFSTLIAPTAIVTPNSRIDKGSAVMAGAIINRATLGKHVIVNSGAIIEHDCHIGNNTFIGPGAIVGGFTDIGNNCFIGLGAKISNGIKISDNITIAMGAVVNRNLTEPGIYHGPSLKRFKIPE